MVGMEMRDDDLRDLLAAQHAGEQRLPDGAGFGRVDSGVEHGETALVLEQVDIHVVEPERQRQTRPQDAVGDRDRLTRRRRRSMGIAQGVGGGRVQ
jgi:hypothetical protein